MHIVHRSASHTRAVWQCRCSQNRRQVLLSAPSTKKEEKPEASHVFRLKLMGACGPMALLLLFCASTVAEDQRCEMKL